MTLLPQVRDQLSDAAVRRAARPHTRPVKHIPVALIALSLIPVVVVAGALLLVHGAPKPSPTTKPVRPTTIQRLVDILAVLRRPQTPADRALPAWVRSGPNIGVTASVGAPDLPLARLAAVAPWGQKVFIVPMQPASPSEIRQLEHRYPGAARAFENRPKQTVTLGLFGIEEASFSSVADIEAGKESLYEGGNSILGLDGPGPPIDVVMVIPDGVAKVTFVLPRQAYPGAIVYPATQTITVPVQNNIAAFETDRYIDQDHWTRIGMTWYAPSGAAVKRIGDFGQLRSVLPDPMLTVPVRTHNRSTWDAAKVIPSTGTGSTTFTVAFRRPVSGAHRYEFRFSGPAARAGCTSPVSRTPVIRGPALGIPSTQQGQIADAQFSGGPWCPGAYRVSVAVAGSRPFSVASFAVPQPGD